MGSKLHELETPEMKLKEIHEVDRSPGEEDQPGKDLRSKRFGPENVSPRYGFRTSNNNEIRPNVSGKRRVESPLTGEPSTKRRRMPMPTSNDSGRTRTIPAKSLRRRRQQIGSSSSGVSFQQVSVGEADFLRVINRKIQVYWSMDEAWYAGLVKRYDPTNKLHHVVYDDGEEEWVSLERDKFKMQILVPGEFSTIPNSGIGQPKSDDLGDKNIEDSKQGNTECLQLVDNDCLQNSGIDISQKRTRRRKFLREEQKCGMDATDNSQNTTGNNLQKEEEKGAIHVSEERNSKRSKHFHGIDDSGIQQGRSLEDTIQFHGNPGSRARRSRKDIIDETHKTSNEDKESPIASFLNHSSTGADDGEAFILQSKSSPVNVYTRRKRKSSDLGSHKVARNGSYHKLKKNSMNSVDDPSTRPSSSGVGEICIGSGENEHAATGELRETCMGNRGDEHAATGASVLAACSAMELEKGLANAELQICPQNSKTNIDNAGGVGEACTGSRGDEHPAIGAPALVASRDTELERAPMNAEFQHCPQNLKTSIGNASEVGETCIRSKGDEHAVIGSSALPDCSDMELEKAPVNAEFQNFPQNLKTYSRKHPRQASCAECSEVPVKRFRKLNLEETAASPSAKRKEIPNYRFGKDVFNFRDDTSVSANLNVSTALKLHRFPLYLREPSYWQCIASGLQLYTMCPVNISRSNLTYIECAKLLSWENLLVFLGTVFRFSSAGSETSSSLCQTQMALQQFEVGGLLNVRKYVDLPLWECLQSMSMRSDVQLELLVFDKMSNAHKLCFWGPFSEVLCNFSMSLASLMRSAASRFNAEMFGFARPVNLNAPVQSITVRFSSLQSGARSSLIWSMDNLHNMASANWNVCKRTLNWFASSTKTLMHGESSKSNSGKLYCSSHHMDYRSKALVRAGPFCNYKEGVEVVKVIKRGVENQHFISPLFKRFNGQYISTVCLNQLKNPLGRIIQCHQPVPFTCLTFVDSPNFFQYLHLKWLFGKAINPDCSPSHGSLTSEKVPNKPTRKRRLSIQMEELVSEDGDLEADKSSSAEHLTIEYHNSTTANDTMAPSSALSSGFDLNVMVTSSQVLPRQNNLAPVFPILKFQRRPTDQRSWHFSGISVPSSEGRTSRHTTHVDSLQPHHIESDLHRGHLVRENQREYNMLQSGAAYVGRMESSQSACSLSISDNADDSMPKSKRSARRGRPSRQDEKKKYKDVELDSQKCATNILAFERGHIWKETGAEVALEALSLNEWVLNVKLDGSTRFRCKAQEPKIRKAHEQKLPRAGEQTPGNPNFHPIIWTSGQDCNLEFTERRQWSLFRKMYEECYSRNLRAASIRNIPIPTVRELDVADLPAVRIPFKRPMNYIKTADDEVSRALFGGRVVYEMDSVDEEWLRRFNSADADYDIRANEVSDETFEGIIDLLEKAAMVQECDLLTVDEALQLCSELAPVEVLKSIHAHWLERRKEKGKALIREFEKFPSKRRNHGRKSLRGKTFRGQHSGKSFTRQPYVRNWRNSKVGTSTEMQLQFNGISSGSEDSSDVVAYSGLYLKAEAEEATRLLRAKREIAEEKRKKAQMLHQVADMKMYKAVMALRNAETIKYVEQARLLRSQASDQTSEQFPVDSSITKNVNPSGLSL